MSWRRIRKAAKRIGRKAAPIRVKAGRVITPVLSAAAGFVAGPVGSAVITAAGAEIGRYSRATQARAEGQHDRARALGRGERKRLWTYGAVGGGVGALASGVTTAALGGGVLDVAAATGGGQGGASLLGASGTVFAKSAAVTTLPGGLTAAQLAAVPSVKAAAAVPAAAPVTFPGGLTAAQLAAVPGVPQAAAAASPMGSGFFTTLGTLALQEGLKQLFPPQAPRPQFPTNDAPSGGNPNGSDQPGDPEVSPNAGLRDPGQETSSGWKWAAAAALAVAAVASA